MKKSLIITALLLCCSLSYATTADADSTKTNETGKKESYSFYKNYSHWSLAVSGGFNFLMSERGQAPGENIINFKDNFLGSFNFEAEYGVNPIWGVALNYVYSPITKTAIYVKHGDYTNNPDHNGQGHQVYTVVNVNLLNLFHRYRNYPKLAWYAGAGIGFYVHNVSEEMFLPKDERVEKWSFIPMFPFESKLEYTPIDALGIFLKVNMSIYLRDNVNINANGPLNDWNLYGGVGIRWNINGQKKKPVRVVDMHTYQDREKAKTEDTATQARIRKLEKEIQELQKAIDKSKNTCCDSIQIIKKQVDINTIDIRTLRVKLDTTKRQINVDTNFSVNSVYFANNSSVITEEYMRIIEKLARIMLEHPEVKLHITSFCSKPGSTNLNDALGKRRFEAVKAVLVNKYKIDADRISSNYHGQIFEGLESDNRRCDFELK